MNSSKKRLDAVIRLFYLSLICLVSLFLVRTVLVSGNPQAPEPAAHERRLKLKTFKDIPLVIREVRNLQSSTWHKDLEIEIKNVSDKPIYFVLAYLIFPDEKVPSGQAGLRLMYGDPKKNGYIDRYSNPADQHIAPGETYVFTIPEVDRKGLKAKHEKFPERTKNLEVEFAIINFGDGTGFVAGRARNYRSKGFKPPPITAATATEL